MTHYYITPIGNDKIRLLCGIDYTPDDEITARAEFATCSDCKAELIKLLSKPVKSDDEKCWEAWGTLTCGGEYRCWRDQSMREFSLSLQAFTSVADHVRKWDAEHSPVRPTGPVIHETETDPPDGDNSSWLIAMDRHGEWGGMSANSIRVAPKVWPRWTDPADWVK